MYTPPILEEEEDEAAEERAYDAQFTTAEAEAEAGGAGGNDIMQPPLPVPAPDLLPASAAKTPAASADQPTEAAPHILVDLPPQVEQTMEEVAEHGGRFGVGRCRAGLYVLREELRHEEQWRYVLPALPRNGYIDFKWRRPPATPQEAAVEVPNPWFIVFRVVLLVYWTSWVTVAMVGAQKGVHIPKPIFEYLGYGALWWVYATNWTAILLWIYLALACLTLVVSAPPVMMPDAEDEGVVHMGRRAADALRTVVWALRDTVRVAVVVRVVVVVVVAVVACVDCQSHSCIPNTQSRWRPRPSWSHCSTGRSCFPSSATQRLWTFTFT